MPRHPTLSVAGAARAAGLFTTLMLALGHGGCGHQAAGAPAASPAPALDNPRDPPPCHCKTPCPAHVEGGPCACPAHRDAAQAPPAPAP